MVMETKTFWDFDDFAASVSGVDCTMLLQNPKHHSWTVDNLVLPEIQLQVGRLGSGNIVEGQSWSDKYLFYLPITDACDYLVNGTVLGQHSFMILEPGCEFCISTKEAHDWYDVLVPIPKLTCSEDIVEPSGSSQETVCRVTRANRQLANRFSESVFQILVAAAQCSEFVSTPAATRATAQLVDIALLVAGRLEAGEACHSGRPRLSRQEIIRICNELLEKRQGSTVTVADLAVAANVSNRTLRTAFNEYYNVGPTRYLQLRRLNRIRHALREADPETASVTDTMAKFGEWEFGRIASRYKQVFGEFPSQTLKNGRQHAAQFERF